MSNAIQYFKALSCLLAASVMFSTVQAQSGPGPARVVDSTVELASGKVFYRDSGGAGIPVVFLHAGSGNSMLWEYQIPVFTAAGYRFIAIDYRGVGGANAGPGGGGTSARISELIARLGLPKFHLIGTAAGGGAALQFALANRDQLRSITVSNSIGNVQDREYTEIGNRIRPAQFNLWPVEMRELGPSYRAANPQGVQRWLALSSEGREVAGPAVPGAAGMAASTTPAGPPPAGAQPGAGAAPANNPNAVTWANLEKFTVPTLLLTGDADLYTPPSVLRMFTARMKQAESAVIPESGHSAFWENPEAFNRVVLDFIARH